MGVTFNWFKGYEIIKTENPISWYTTELICSVNYIEHDSTSHSYGNRSKLQDLFEKVNCRIPTIPDEIFNDEDVEEYIESLLVSPSEMSKKCEELLNSEFDLQDMEDRITRIKELSDKGYYVTYDML